MLIEIWHRKWTILTTCVVTAATTAVASYYLLPVRYLSESSIMVTSPQVIGIQADSRLRGLTAERLEALTQIVLSRTRLERVMDDLKMYEAERATERVEALVERMRGDVRIALMTDNQSEDSGARLTVSVVAAEPDTAQRAAQRLTGELVQENLRRVEVAGSSRVQFIRSRLAVMRKQVEESEQVVAAQRRAGQTSQADIIEYEVRQQTLRTLLINEQEAEFELAVNRRQIGEQFRIIDGARVPKQPVGPNRLAVNVTGGFAGLTFGLVLAVAMAFRQRRAAGGPTG